MAPHSSTFAWKIPWTEEPGRLHSPWGRWGSDSTEWLHFHFSLSCMGEGNGNPLQCSCLENPRDGGAWWAAIYGVAQSWTRLKQLSSSSRRQVKEDIAVIYVWVFCLYFPLKSFIVFSFIFRSLIYFEFIFVYGVRGIIISFFYVCCPLIEKIVCSSLYILASFSIG